MKSLSCLLSFLLCCGEDGKIRRCSKVSRLSLPLRPGQPFWSPHSYIQLSFILLIHSFFYFFLSAQIADPEDKKPEGWDDIPAQIADPDAKKPEDWDEDEDGAWEAPMIDNPEYLGEWKPKMIDNPAYKGPWVHPEIDNPEYAEDPKLYVRAKDVSFVGFELWQVKSGTLFDDILITDSIEEANKYAQETFYKKKDGEKEMFDKIEEEREAKEKAEREEMVRYLSFSPGKLAHTI